MSATNRPRKSTAGSATKRKSGSTGSGSGDLIVTRGLQDILEQDLARKRAQASPAGGTSPGASASKRKKVAGRSTGPNFVICYLCGRQFGTASIDIHRPQCYLKKMIEWERGEPGIRGPKPVDPETHERQIKERMAAGGADTVVGRGAGGRLSDIDAYNAAQFEAFQTQALSPCPNCGRTFLPDRLQVHLRSCKPGSTAKPIARRGSDAAPEAAAGAASSPPAPPQQQPIASSKHVDTTAGGLEDKPIRAAGAYRLPEDATEDSVPTGAAASGAVKTKSPSHSRRGGGRSSQSLSATAAPPQHDDDSDTDIAFMEEVGEEAPPISPSAAAEEAVMGLRHPSADEPEGVSTPTRYASMEPDLENGEEEPIVATEKERHLEFHNYVAEERRASNARDADAPPSPVHDTREAANAVKAAMGRRDSDEDSDDADAGASAPAAQPRRSSGLPTAEERRRLREENARRNGSRELVMEKSSPSATRGSVGTSIVGAEDGSDDGPRTPGGTPESMGKRTIPLNNVSRFKNVPSRLKVEREQQEVSLTPCKFCGRTFNPARIAKHESCCLERNKAPAPAVNRTRRSVGGGPAPSAPAPAKRASTSSSASPATDGNAGATAVRFCGECGAKYATAGQKFCVACGAKCVA